MGRSHHNLPRTKSYGASATDGTSDATETESEEGRRERRSEITLNACLFIARALLQRREVTKGQFIGDEEPYLSQPDFEKFPEGEWSRARNGVFATLQVLGYRVSKSKNRIKIDKSPSTAFNTSGFRSDRNAAEKQKIGAFVAEYLVRTEEEVFLGTGSTVLNIGKYMVAGGEERYCTINLPLAAEWASRDPEGADAFARKRAPSRITVFGGVLDTDMFRYRNLLQDERAFAVSVVGADGCLYAGDAGKLFLKDEGFAKITNDFILNTQHSVIVCVARAKMGDGPANISLQHTGPQLTLPTNERCRRIIVTEDEPGRDIRDAFAKDNWVIITPQMGWPTQERTEDGETRDLSARDLFEWARHRVLTVETEVAGASER